MSAAQSFRKHFTKKALKRIYTEKIKSSTAIGRDHKRPNKLEKDLDKELSLIIRKISEGNYSFTPYKEKLILKSAKSLPRKISIPTARDRIVLRALCEWIGEMYPQAKLELPHKKIDDLSSKLKQNAYTEYAKIDLKDFYSSIRHDLITKPIWKKVRKKELRKLIESAITTPTISESQGVKILSSSRNENEKTEKLGVPQGLAISNLLAEIALQDIDTQFHRNDIWYCRYVDDILILTSAKPITNFAEEVVSSLKKLGLESHPLNAPNSKSHSGCITDPFNFLGYQIQDNQILVRRENILRFESSIARIFCAYSHERYELKQKNKYNDKGIERARRRCQWKVNLRVTGCFLNGRRLGWLSYFSQITSTAQLHAINYTIHKLIKRYCPEGGLRIKSLIKTFYEINSPNTRQRGFIPDLDNLHIKEKRNLVALWIGDKADALSQEEVEEQFKLKVIKFAKQQEMDIAYIS